MKILKTYPIEINYEISPKSYPLPLFCSATIESLIEGDLKDDFDRKNSSLKEYDFKLGKYLSDIFSKELSLKLNMPAKAVSLSFLYDYN